MEKELRVIETGLDERNKKYNEILRSVIGQLSDGMWENCNRLIGYWIFDEATGKDNKIVVSNEPYEWDKRGSRKYKNPYLKMTDQEIREFYAKKIKQIIREELKDNYQAEIAREIFKKYDLEKYSHMVVYPIAREEDYRKAKQEYEDYIKENPYKFKGQFNSTNETDCIYLNYYENVQGKDAYEVYQALVNFEKGE